MNTLDVVKGHGTENDFVLVLDVSDERAEQLTPSVVRAVCDRRAGLGADGLIRVVPTAAIEGYAAHAGQAEWFMDYRNADGSVAEMCGNGARVFAQLLVERGLVDGDLFAIATRGGVRPVERRGAEFAIDMGVPVLPEGPTEVSVDQVARAATPVFIPNPHAVVAVDDLAQAGALREPPAVHPASIYPDGANVEFVVVHGDGHLSMRVHERGSGETRSCGTGACAAAVAARRWAPGSPARVWRVDVPGGSVTVEEREDGHVVLAGPSVLVATATIDLDRLAPRS